MNLSEQINNTTVTDNVMWLAKLTRNRDEEKKAILKDKLQMNFYSIFTTESRSMFEFKEEIWIEK